MPEKRELMRVLPNGAKVYAVHGFNPFDPPDHPAFDEPSTSERWRRIHKVAVCLLGMDPERAYWHACETVFSDLKTV